MDHRTIRDIIASVSVLILYLSHVVLSLGEIKNTLQMIIREIDTRGIIMHRNNDLRTQQGSVIFGQCNIRASSQHQNIGHANLKHLRRRQIMPKITQMSYLNTIHVNIPSNIRAETFSTLIIVPALHAPEPRRAHGSINWFA